RLRKTIIGNCRTLWSKMWDKILVQNSGQNFDQPCNVDATITIFIQQSVVDYDTHWTTKTSMKIQILIAFLLILSSVSGYNMTYDCNGSFDVVFLMDGSGRFE